MSRTILSPSERQQRRKETKAKSDAKHRQKRNAYAKEYQTEQRARVAWLEMIRSKLIKADDIQDEPDNWGADEVHPEAWKLILEAVEIARAQALGGEERAVVGSEGGPMDGVGLCIVGCNIYQTHKLVWSTGRCERCSFVYPRLLHL